MCPRQPHYWRCLLQYEAKHLAGDNSLACGTVGNRLKDLPTVEHGNTCFGRNSPLRARASQLIVCLNSSCSQTELKDHITSLWATCDQHGQYLSASRPELPPSPRGGITGSDPMYIWLAKLCSRSLWQESRWRPEFRIAYIWFLVTGCKRGFHHLCYNITWKQTHCITIKSNVFWRWS